MWAPLLNSVCLQCADLSSLPSSVPLLYERGIIIDSWYNVLLVHWDKNRRENERATDKQHSWVSYYLGF